MKRNAPVLQMLARATPRRRKDILKGCSADVLHSLAEIALNLLKGNIPLSPSQFQKLKRHKKLIRLLADRKTTVKRKRNALQQTGGFLLPLLSAAIPIVGELIGGLVRRRG